MPIKRNTLVFSLLALVAIPATVYLAQQQQLAKKQASEPIRNHLKGIKPKSVPGEVLLKVNPVALPQPSQQSILSKQAAPAINGRFSYVDGFQSVEPILAPEHPQRVSAFSSSTTDKQDSAVFLKLTVNPSIDTDNVINQLKADPAVLDAQPNYYRYTNTIPNDTDYINQWHLNDTNDHDIDAPEAWDLSTGSSQVTVAVVDSGVDYTHPDLAQKIAVNQQEFGGGKESNGIDDDGNGFIDDYRGWNFVHNTNDPLDQNGHGTHVSGIIAASTNNAIGVAGINWSAPILPVRVCGQSECSCAAIVSGIAYAADRAQVINMSLGGSMQCLGEAEAVAYAEEKGVVVVAAAGNSNTSSPSYPAYHESVIAVAALDRDDKRSSFSNFGEWVDIAAPGRDILSSILPGAQLSSTCGDSDGNGYATCSGTSMASPVVAGVVSLVRGLYPNLTPSQIRSVVELSANSITALNPGFEKKLGTGKVNAQRALTETFFTRITTPTNKNVYNQASIDIKGTAWSITNQGMSFTLEYSSDGQTWQTEGISYPSGQVTAIIDGILGKLNTSNLQNGSYTVRMTVVSGGQTRQSTSQFNFDRNASVTVKEGWPIQCEGCAGGGYFVGGARVPFNVSLGSGKGAIGLINGPFLWGADGNKLPNWPPTELTQQYTYTVYKMFGDVQGDGVKDIFVLRKELNQQNIYEWRDVMTWYDQSGHVILNKTMPYARQLETISPVGISTEDLDGDGKSEVIFISSRYVYELSGGLYVPRLKGTDVLVYDTDLNIKWQQYIPAFTANSAQVFSIGDTNGDGKKEIILSLTARSEIFPKASAIYGFNYDGTGIKNTEGLIKEYIFTGGETYYPEYLAIADLDNDGLSELVLQHSYIYLRVLDIHGNERFRLEHPVYEIASPAIGDLNGDGMLEIVFAATDIANDNQIYKWYTQLYAYNYNGTPYLKDNGLMTETFVDFYDYNKGEPWYYPAATTLGDISGDGKPDIVTSWQPFDTIWAYSANTGGPNGSINLLPGWPVYGEGQFGYTTSVGVDTDGGGRAEVFALDWRGDAFLLYRYGTNGLLNELGRPWPFMRGNDRFNGTHTVRNPLIPTSTPVAPTSTITPTPTYLPVPTQSPNAGQAIAFDGTTSDVKIDDTTQAFMMPHQFTIEAWIKPSQVNDFQTIIGRLSPSFGLEYRLFIFTTQDGKADLRFSVSGMGNQSSAVMPVEAWSHIAVIRDESTVRGYINGTKVFDKTDVIYNKDDENSSFTQIGAWKTPIFSGNRFKGAMDEVRISNTVRDVSALWNSGAYFQNLPSDEATMGLWHFDGTVADSSSHNVSSIGEGTYTYVNGLIPPVVLTPTSTVILSPIPTQTSTPTPSPSMTPTPMPTSSPTPLPSSTPTTTPTPTTVPSPTPSPTPTPTVLRDTIGIFRPSNAVFYLRNSNTNGVADIVLGYGMRGDIPLVGDWDGDGVQTPGVFRKGTFYLRNSNTSGPADTTVAYGLPADIPVVGDWDGDGKESIGVYRNGLAFLRNTNSIGNADYVFFYGQKGDLPVAGDWDGDGKDTLAVLRSRKFFMRNTNTSGPADRVVSMDKYDGLPVAGDWDRNGKDGVGVFKDGVFTTLNYDLVSPAFVRIWYGQKGDIPLSGVWKK